MARTTARSVKPNDIGIEIEAALAFGTGHHGTTRGCLLALDDLAKRRRARRVLDVGTGSGVLAIAAAKRLRARIIASDIDRVAVEAARGNARLNRAGGAITFVRAAGAKARAIAAGAPYDLIFANILLGPLLRLAVPLSRLAAPGAHVVLSGLLPEPRQCRSRDLSRAGPRARAAYSARRLGHAGDETPVTRSTFMEKAVGIRGAHPNEFVREPAMRVDSRLDAGRIGVP